MASENYLNNPLLKNTNVKITYTKEQLDEYMKSSEDPIYFIENYLKIVSLDEGLIPFKMYDFQKKIVLAMHNNRFVVGKFSRQVGKCLYINTEVRLRNKKTGEIVTKTIGELYNGLKPPQNLPIL